MAKKYPFKFGERLLVYGEFRDSNGDLVRVHSASSVEPHVWVTCLDRDGDDATPFLSRQTARQLRDALDRWLRRQS